jgi:hypothetical protein
MHQFGSIPGAMIYRTRPGEIVQIVRDRGCMWAVVGRAGAEGYGACAEIPYPGTASQRETAGLLALHALMTTIKCGRLPVIWRSK